VVLLAAPLGAQKVGKGTKNNAPAVSSQAAPQTHATTPQQPMDYRQARRAIIATLSGGGSVDVQVRPESIELSYKYPAAIAIACNRLELKTLGRVTVTEDQGVRVSIIMIIMSCSRIKITGRPNVV